MKYSKFITLILALGLIQALHLKADSFSEFEQEMESYDNPNESEVSAEYVEFVNNYLSDFDQWRAEYLNEFDIKQKEIARQWGSAEVTGREENIEYSTSLGIKAVAATDSNELTIEVLVDASLSDKNAKKIAAGKIAEFNQKNKSTFIKAEQVKAATLKVESVEYTSVNEEKTKAVIKNQTITYLKNIEIEADKLVLENESIPEELIEKIIENKKSAIKKEEAKRLAQVESSYKKLRADNAKRASKNTHQKVVRYKVKLPANSLSKRADLYVPYAEKESERFDIPVALVMAIMHSESAFKYKAKSGVPAYGLMQIVPRTAGHDVNKRVRNKDEPMTPQELYIPEVNIETGVAYLNIVNKQYLRKIENDESRLYCTIAAYNTGAGNVAKAFNIKGQGSTRNIHRASAIINKLTPEEVYDQLMKNLPYDETKHYLERVSSRIALYQT